MDGHLRGKAALIVVNWEYEGYEDLQFPENDGDMMENIFKQAEFDKIKVVKNCDDILDEIDEFIKESNKTELDLFHFHYSGIGSCVFVCATDVFRAWRDQRQY